MRWEGMEPRACANSAVAPPSLHLMLPGHAHLNPPSPPPIARNLQSKGGQPQDTVGGGDEQVSLDDTRYIADVLFDFKAAKAKEGTAPRLLFRKKMFRETDEAITEPRFMALSYIQAQHDYLEGQYPVIRDDAAQMAALQVGGFLGGGGGVCQGWEPVWRGIFAEVAKG